MNGQARAIPLCWLSVIPELKKLRNRLQNRLLIGVATPKRRVRPSNTEPEIVCVIEYPLVAIKMRAENM